MAAVELRQVRKSFGNVEIFDGVDLTIDEGEFVVFVGPSGSGKSTLLRMIAGLEMVTDGDVLIDGENVTFAEPSDRGIAMVFQSYALYPHMNVYNNMAFNLRLSRFSKSEVDSRVREAARILKLGDLLNRSPAQLSGGQRQRVAIGRAIVRKPKVFLFDEPLTNLDAALRVQMRLEIERLHRELDATMIYVTHDQVEAMTLADRIVVIDDGNLQQIGKPLELYANPTNKFVAGFIGSPKMNFLEASVSAVNGDQATISFAADADATMQIPDNDLTTDDKVTIGVRPENFRVLASEAEASGDRSRPSATVETIERLGNINSGYFQVGAAELITVQIRGQSDLNSGQQVWLGLPHADFHIFDASGQSLVVGSET